GGGRDPGSRGARPEGDHVAARGQHHPVPVAFPDGAAVRVRVPAQPPRRRDPGGNAPPLHPEGVEAPGQGGGPRAHGRPFHRRRAGGGGAQGARDPRGAAVRTRAPAGRAHHRRPALRAPRPLAGGARRRRPRRAPPTVLTVTPRRGAPPPAVLTVTRRRWAASGFVGLLALTAPFAAPQSRSAVPVSIVYGGDAPFAPYASPEPSGDTHGIT